MSNTLTLSNYAPDVYAAMDQVARELTGIIPSIMINSSGIDRANIGATVESFRTSEPTVNSSVTPAMQIPEADDHAVDQETMTITQTANVKIPVKGEDERKMNMGYGAERVRQDLFKQAIRKIVNQIEAHAGSVIYKSASRAIGTAGTNPFNSNHHGLIDLRKVLNDNGCPDDGERIFVMGSAEATKFQQLTSMYKVNESGSNELLRRGTLGEIAGFVLKESRGIQTHTKGSGSGYLIDLTEGYGVGDTEIHVDTGTGTILAGDVITIADDPSAAKYVVREGFGGDGDGDIVVQWPGLLGTAANNKAVTIGSNYTANLGFHRSAVELALRAPLLPPGGDDAADRLMIADEQTGLVFEIALYKGYLMNMFDLTVHYGVKVWKPDFVATLMG